MKPYWSKANTINTMISNHFISIRLNFLYLTLNFYVLCLLYFLCLGLTLSEPESLACLDVLFFACILCDWFTTDQSYEIGWFYKMENRNHIGCITGLCFFYLFVWLWVIIKFQHRRIKLKFKL
jgi:hypothetical protein